MRKSGRERAYENVFWGLRAKERRGLEGFPLQFLAEGSFWQLQDKAGETPFEVPLVSWAQLGEPFEAQSEWAKI